MITKNFLEIIHTRRSVRKYESTLISKEDQETILRAAMIAPTARNTQSWRFIVVEDRAILNNLVNIHPVISYALTAPLGILVCGDSTTIDLDYWVQDASAATQNMLLTARALGIGSVWCGVHPRPERISSFRAEFNLPETIHPLGMILFGYPDKESGEPFAHQDRFDPKKIHYNKW